MVNTNYIAQGIASRIKHNNAKIAIILGSGYEKMVDIKVSHEIKYVDLGLYSGEVEGHKRKLVFGTVKGIPVVLVSRFHFYENGTTEDIFILYHVLSLIGIKTMISTTAVGGINPNFLGGDIMLIKDHINYTGNNPLIGKQPVKFLDVSNAYDKKLRELTKKIAKDNNIALWEGVHLQTSGPTYETPAEVRMYHAMGADTVSMSTVFDCICACYYDIKIIAFAGISNKAITEESEPLSHEFVLKVSKKISKKLGILIDALIPLL